MADEGNYSRCRNPQMALRMKELYNALKAGDRFKVRDLYSPDLVLEEWPLTILDDTVLHIAFYFRHEDIVEEILCDIGISEEELMKPNKIGNTVLHEAATTDMTKVVDRLLEMAPDLLWKRNHHGETPLFRAAHYGQTEMFQLLAKWVEKVNKVARTKSRKVEEIISHLRRNDGTTALHIAILAESFDTALMIAKNYKVMLDARDKGGSTGLHLLSTMSSAFKSGSNLTLVKRFIYSCALHEDRNVHEDPNEDTNVPHGTMDLDRKTWDVENAGSRSPKFRQTSQTKKSLTVVTSEWSIEEVRKEKEKHASAMRLAKFLIENDISWIDNNTGAYPWMDGNAGAEDDIISVIQPMHSASNVSGAEQNEGKGKDQATQPNQPGGQIEIPVTGDNATWSDENLYYLFEMKRRVDVEAPLLVATRSGIIEIVKEILEMYPQAVEHVNPSRQNILHVAVKNRRKKIFDLVMDNTITLTRLTLRIDADGNTILHQVAFREDYHGLELTGPAFMLQNELYWFKAVKKVLPPHYLMHRNSEGLTAKQLFSREHEKLLDKAQEWMKRTSESSSLVAVLIATVAFAAAYTIPGGSDEKTGLPKLLNQPFFLVFTVMDVLSLASSLTSVVMFLSILTSPFHLKKFQTSLPLRLTLGFTLLFFSIATMMLAFAATVILTIHVNRRSITLLLYVVAFFPVSIFALLQLPLYTNLAASILRKALPNLNIVSSPFWTTGSSDDL